MSQSEILEILEKQKTMLSVSQLKKLVSCNPTSLSRSLKKLREYDLVKLQISSNKRGIFLYGAKNE